MHPSSALKLLSVMFILLIASSAQAGVLDSLKDRVRIHGYASQGFLGSTHNRYMFQKTSSGSFEFNDVAVYFNIDLVDNLRIAFQVGSHDLGYIYHNHIELDWGFLEYQPLDWLGFRGGRIKVPMGLYNETREMDAARVPIFLPQSVYNEADRDCFSAADGGSIFGNISLGRAGSLSYTFLVGILRARKDGGHATQFEYHDMITVDRVDYDVSYASGLTWNTPIDGLLFNATNFYGHSADVDFRLRQDVMPLVGLTAGKKGYARMGRINSITFSSEYTYRKWLFAAEFRYVDLRIRRKMDSPIVGRIYESYGYRFTGAYLSGAYEVTDKFSMGSYVSYFKSPGPNSKINTGKTMDYCMSFRYDITHWALLKLEGHYFHGDSILLDRDQKRPKRDWLFYALKFTVFF